MDIAATETTAPGGRTARPLARHVLLPAALLAALGAAAATGAATRSAHDAAVRELDARAEVTTRVATSALRRGGRASFRSVAAGAAKDGVGVRLVPADRPLPGGRSIESRDGTRVHTTTIAGREARRVEVSVAEGSVGAATLRALLSSLAIALLLLAGALALVRWRLQSGVVVPLRRLGRAVERLRAGEQPGDLVPRGPAELRALSEGLAELSGVVAELESQATTDPLTGVANRRSFHTALEREMKRAERDGAPMTLVLVDLDGFKEINDTHGHPFGDGILQMVADKLQAVLRATDVLARVGGDEFAIVLPATARAQAAQIVERARAEAAGSVAGISLTWCAGVASFPSDARDGSTLVECADAALYCAKSTGRSSVLQYDPQDDRTARAHGERAAVEAVLAKDDAVVPVFQPLVSLSTGQIAGYEALARFPHPPARRPDEWFAAAQSCGLGPELEARAVREALRARGRPAGTYLSFNLSASALFADVVMEVLPEDLSEVVIEITENERVGDDDALAARLEPLRRRGARIAIDDAGAGYSGLQQVMRVHPDLIKLDRSLVANVDTDPAKAALIDSFVRFARRTGAHVCAEGIETPEELKVLSDLDVTYGQGFGLARPAAPWAPVSPWVAATIRPRTIRTETGPAAVSDAQENADLRLAQLSSRIANATSAADLPELAALIETELGADEVCLLKLTADGLSLEALTVHRWIERGGRLTISNYPTMRQILKGQEVVQVLAGDTAADLGELSFLRRGGHGSMLLAPVVSQGRVAGVFASFRATEQPWDRTETSRARIVAHQLGPVVESLAAAPLAAVPRLEVLPGREAQGV